MSKSVQAIVTGRVQGVGFRAWAESEAKQRKLAGWVRNRRDGSVEVLLSGADDAVDELLARLWQGPLDARVERVQFGVTPPPMGIGFRVLPTA